MFAKTLVNTAAVARIIADRLVFGSPSFGSAFALTQNVQVVCDEILIQELRSPGADVRFGVNFISRPCKEIIERIATIQAEILKSEPYQYFYPHADLHLTVFEIAYSLEPREAERLAHILQMGAGAFHNLPVFDLVCEGPVFDERAGRLGFRPADDGFSVLQASLENKIRAVGIIPKPRRNTVSPHITFLRYLRPLRDDRWIPRLGDLPVLKWSVSEMCLTWGANWFGKRSRIRERGPFILVR